MPKAPCLVLTISCRIDHALIRQMVVHYIAQHPDDFQMDVQSEGYESVREYCQHMAYDRTWGDGICLQCFTIVFNINVWLCYNRDGVDDPMLGEGRAASSNPLLSLSHNSFTVGAFKEGAPNLALLLTNNHYDRILSWGE